MFLLSAFWVMREAFRSPTAGLHPQRVEIVTVSGKPLQTVFEGLSPDSRYDVSRVLAAKERFKQGGRCSDAVRPGVFGRLLSFFTPKTVRADEADPCPGDQPCNPPSAQIVPQPCLQGLGPQYCWGFWNDFQPDPVSRPNKGIRPAGRAGCPINPPPEGSYCPYCNYEECNLIEDPPRCTYGECDPADICLPGYSCNTYDGCCYPDPRTYCGDNCTNCRSDQVCGDDGYCTNRIGVCIGGVWKPCDGPCPPEYPESDPFEPDCCKAGSGGGDGGGGTPTCDVYDPWSCSCDDDWFCQEIYGNDYGCDEWNYCDSLYADGPLLIDVNGDGYSLTSAAEGVAFDLRANGKPIKFSWTAPGSDDAWLALDRNGNGLIDDGSELFGNSTPHSGTGRDTNGFKALAFYDLPENGGNGDGVIDLKDSIFSRLLLWVDGNHNGISDPGELHTLSRAGANAIMLDYKPAKWEDAFGNRFRFRSKMVKSKPGPGADHWMYDVYLVPNMTR
jgi:hypothetical protein